MYQLLLHKELNLEKWSDRTKAQQILMIANELNRANNFIKSVQPDSVNLCYERAFELIDLTSSDIKWKGRIKEFRRCRELLAEQYMNEKKDKKVNKQLYMGLLRLSPEAYKILYPAKIDDK